jgi:hypothetical protein
MHGAQPVWMIAPRLVVGVGAISLLVLLAGCSNPSGTAASGSAVPSSSSSAAGSSSASALTGSAAPPSSTGTGTAHSPATASKGSPAASRSALGAVFCRTPPKQGVYSPDRLILLKACQSVTGIVVEVHPPSPDGDHTFNLRLDAAFASLENAKNVAEGGLHIEIVPPDQPGCVKGQTVFAGGQNLGPCSGADIPLPRVGQHIQVTGAYVQDTGNGWNELHPIWQLQLLP